MLSKSKLSPMFGIGWNTYQEYTHGYVAHNSFVQIFVEYGFLGGAFFVGLFYLLVSGFIEVGKHESLIDDPEMRRIRTFLLAIFAAEIIGMMSITRCYVISTYTFVGMGEVYLELCSKIPGMPSRRVEAKTVVRIFQAAAVVFAVIYIYAKIKMRSIG
jgi:O-antigen ligase